MMRTLVSALKSLMFVWLVLAMAGSALAHDPVFGLGPHVLFKGGVETHLGAEQAKAGSQRASKVEAQFSYGITGDWSAGIGIPYIRAEGPAVTEEGRGATDVFTKYRFWRKDSLGVQESAAVLGKIIFDDANFDPVQREDNDYLLGLAYGYEGRKWYRWASVRRRINSDAANGAQRPGIWFLDLVGGVRFTPTEYTQPDWVWMLELNGEIVDTVTNRVGGVTTRLGGTQWFVSPGLMWTLRNFAIKAGVQIPVYDDLEANRPPDDYRASLEFELHM